MRMREVLSESNCAKAIRALFYVAVFWLPYSPAVIETCVVLALLIWFVRSAVHPGSAVNTVVHDPNRFAVLLFLIIGFLSLLENSMGLGAFKNFLTKTFEWFVIYYLVCDVFRERKHFLCLIAVLLVTSAATALDALYQYYISHKDIFLGHEIISGESPTAGFKTPNGLGAFLAAVFPIVFFYGWEKKRSVIYLAAVSGVCVFLLWALAVSASRGAMAAVILAAALAALLIGMEKFFGIVRGKTAAVLAVCALVFILSFAFTKSFSAQKVISANWRIEIWKESIELIKKQPLLGYGINMYMPQYQNFRKPVAEGGISKYGPTYAHNCFIQICFETGVLGLAVFLWIVGSVLKSAFDNFYQLCKKDRAAVFLPLGLLVSLSTMLVHSFFDNHLYSLQLSAMFWIVCGLIMAVNRNLLNKGEAKNA